MDDDDYIVEVDEVLEEEEGDKYEGIDCLAFFPLQQDDGTIRAIPQGDIKYIALFDKNRLRVSKLKPVNLPKVRVEEGSKVILTWEVEFF